MHNSFLRRFTVLPERQRGGGSCGDEVLHESVPGPQPELWRHRDEDLILPSTIFPFPLLFFFNIFFYSQRRTSSYTRSWMGKHKVSSNVLQLNTGRKKEEKKERLHKCKYFFRENGSEKTSLFWGICKLSVSRWGVISIQQQQDFLVTVATHNMV